MTHTPFLLGILFSNNNHFYVTFDHDPPTLHKKVNTICQRLREILSLLPNSFNVRLSLSSLSQTHKNYKNTLDMEETLYYPIQMKENTLLYTSKDISLC